MNIVCSYHNFNELEQLNDELEAHCYALDLLMNQEGFGKWPEARYKLLYERVSMLAQTCFDLRTFTSALKEGADFNGGQ